MRYAKKRRSSHRRRHLPLTFDQATRMMTSFRDLNDMLFSVREHGYVPTIRADAATTMPYRKAALMLRRTLNRRGARVYPSYGSYKTER